MEEQSEAVQSAVSIGHDVPHPAPPQEAALLAFHPARSAGSVHTERVIDEVSENGCAANAAC